MAGRSGGADESKASAPASHRCRLPPHVAEVAILEYDPLFAPSSQLYALGEREEYWRRSQPSTRLRRSSVF